MSVFNNSDHPEFYDHQTSKVEHRERVNNPAAEYYEKAKPQGVKGGNEYYEQSKKQQQHGSEYYAPLRLPVNCSGPEVELRTTSHSVSEIENEGTISFLIVRITSLYLKNLYDYFLTFLIPGESSTRELLCGSKREGDQPCEGGGEEGGGDGGRPWSTQGEILPHQLLFIPHLNCQVLLRLRQERRTEDKPTRREKNRTWGQATLQKGRERGNIKDLDYGHNYENVYGGDDDEDEGIERGRRHSEKGRAPLYRSKSCDRAGVRGAVRDQVIDNQEPYEMCADNHSRCGICPND